MRMAGVLGLLGYVHTLSVQNHAKSDRRANRLGTDLKWH
jgi:hypothetical protein